MSTPADKVVITIQGGVYNIECYAGRVQFAGTTVELSGAGTEIGKYGDDLFVELPIEQASALEDLELKLLDVSIALMEAA